MHERTPLTLLTADQPPRPIDPEASLASVRRRGARRGHLARAGGVGVALSLVASVAVAAPRLWFDPVQPVVADEPTEQVVETPSDTASPSDEATEGLVPDVVEPTLAPVTESEPAADAGAAPALGAPSVTILAPADGSTQGSKEVALEGTATPGARVHVGPWEADVDADGRWRLVLVLAKGTTTITVVAETDAGEARDTVTVTYAPPVAAPKPAPKPGSETGSKTGSKTGSGTKDGGTTPGATTFSASQDASVAEGDPPSMTYRGTAPAGAAVKVFSDWGHTVTTAGSDGRWVATLTLSGAPYGEHRTTVWAKLKDQPDVNRSFELTTKRGSAVAFTASNTHGRSDANPPSDVYHGTAAPGSVVKVKSEYLEGGRVSTTANADGRWEVTATFVHAPRNSTFDVGVWSEAANDWRWFTMTVGP
ncbi:MAG: hypothetical protein ACLGIR_07755 [Actinomycetes bacterium]